MFTREQWSRDLLAALGNGTPSQTVVDFLVGWTVAETNTDSGAHFNLLNTEWKEPDSSNFNDVGVQIFTSYKEGIQATISTLEDGYYPDILQALTSNNVNALMGPNAAILKELNIWSGNANYGHTFLGVGPAHRGDPFHYGSGESVVTPAGPTDTQMQEAIDAWNSFFGTLKFGGSSIATPPMGTGIFDSWLSEWIAGRYRGVPVTWEYRSKNWEDKSITVQEFTKGRCEWDGSPHWL